MSNFSTSGSEGQCVWSWVGGDKEQSLVVSATDNERSVCLAVILLVWIRWPVYLQVLGPSPAALLFSSQHVL